MSLEEEFKKEVKKRLSELKESVKDDASPNEILTLLRRLERIVEYHIDEIESAYDESDAWEESEYVWESDEESPETD